MRREKGEKPITFTRSRPYKKNDNCYVEQKNFTHVRELFGYERIEDPTLIPLMNEIYKNYWNPLQNFFLPTFKLREKIRLGARLLHLDPLNIKRVTVISNEFHIPMVKYTFKTILGSSIELNTVSASNDGKATDELKKYGMITAQMVSKCYPILFEGNEGNMRSFHLLINRTEKDPGQKQRRAAFEKYLREILCLDEDTPIWL